MTKVANPKIEVVDLTSNLFLINPTEPTIHVDAYQNVIENLSNEPAVDTTPVNPALHASFIDDNTADDEGDDLLNTAFIDEGDEEEDADVENFISDVVRSVIEKDLDRLKTLHQEGHDLHATDEDGYMALDFAAELGYRAIEQYLARDLFLEAASCGDVELINKSLEFFETGVDLASIKDARGATAMHLAAESCNLAMLKHLHAKGISVDVEDHAGQAPIEYIEEEEGVTGCGIFLMSAHVAAAEDTTLTGDFDSVALEIGA